MDLVGEDAKVPMNKKEAKAAFNKILSDPFRRCRCGCSAGRGEEALRTLARFRAAGRSQTLQRKNQSQLLQKDSWQMRASQELA